MRMAARSLAASLALVPCTALADTESYNAGYRLGWLVGSFIKAYGVHMAAAALIGAVAWLLFGRSRVRDRRRDD